MSNDKLAAALHEPEWVTLRVLVVNTHVGLLLTSAVRFLKRQHRYHVVLLQEVTNPVARARLRLVFGLRRWRLVGTRPPALSRGASGTIIATRRARLRHVSHSNRLITAQRFVNGVRDRWHPERRLTRGVYIDKRSDVELMICSLHPWHIRGGPQSVVDEHDRQVKLYAQAAADAHKLDQIALLGGDMNEGRARGVAREALAEIGMTTITWDHIDGVWVTHDRDVRCVSVETIPMTRWRGGEEGHEAISVTLQLRVR